MLNDNGFRTKGENEKKKDARRLYSWVRHLALSVDEKDFTPFEAALAPYGVVGHHEQAFVRMRLNQLLYQHQHSGVTQEFETVVACLNL